MQIRSSSWGGVFRTIFTVLGWIYLVVGGTFIGFAFIIGQQYVMETLYYF